MTKNFVKSSGPVSFLELPVPAEGGVVVFRGRNGTGKSITLNNLQSAVSGEGRMPVKRGEDFAEMQFLGVHIKAGKQTRRSGALVVDSLEGKFSIADLVDPGIKDVDAADRKRIMAVIQVCGTKADPALFYNLVGGEEQFRQFVTKDTLKNQDLVELSSGIRRDFQKKANDLEIEVAEQTARIDGLKMTTTAKTVEKPVSQIEDELKQARTVAAREAAKREESLNAINRHKESVEKFNLMVDPAAELTALKADQEARTKEYNALWGDIEILRAKLQQLEVNFSAAKVSKDSAEKLVAAAAKAVESYQQFKETIDAGQPVEHPESIVNEANQKAEELQSLLVEAQAFERSETVRKEIEELTATAEKNRNRASALRGAAAGVDDVLSEQISKINKILCVQDGRLMAALVGEKKLFAELSDGERWKIAIDISAEAIGEGGVLILPQKAWQDLDPIAQKLVADHARERRVVIFTAECTADDSIKAEVV